MRTLSAIALTALTLNACSAFTDLEDEHGFEINEPADTAQIDEPDADQGEQDAEHPDDECLDPERLDLNDLEAVEGTENCFLEVRDTYPDLVFSLDSDEPTYCVDDDEGCYNAECGDAVAECYGIRRMDRNNANNTSPPDLVGLLGCQEAISALEAEGFSPEAHYPDQTPDTLNDQSFELCLDAATQIVGNYEDPIAELATQEALEYACREGLFQCF